MKTQLFPIISMLAIVSVTLVFHSTVNGRTIMNEKEWPRDVEREDDYLELERRQVNNGTNSSPAAPTGSSTTAAGSTSPTFPVTGISTAPNTASTSNETSSSTISSTTATVNTSTTTAPVIPSVIGPDYYPDYDFNTHLDYVYPM